MTTAIGMSHGSTDGPRGSDPLGKAVLVAAAAFAETIAVIVAEACEGGALDTALAYFALTVVLAIAAVAFAAAIIIQNR
ncbi:hypothetical protein AB0J83_38815 [Actinoplanes sp. NPDC049596]|uniref:hypothetical protein n=1 Tax=unclassified Actinoplanes TaxID=2626549 RepID=UPI003448C7EB